MNQNKIRNFTLLASCLLSGLGFTIAPACAQIIPDDTLGNEGSRVTPNVLIRGGNADRIDGGASRGSNLFHSFQDFNISDGQRVYFNNPAGITNIFSRITGTNRSHILGTLGVDGTANLFLLNPNGILFGANARLDISGSFVATTANAIQFGDRGFFSASSPEQSSLLEINPSALLFNQIAAQGGEITNAGNLQVGQDLTLSGQNLDLQGQLWAGNHLTLQAQDTVRIRDSVIAPVIAAARGALVVQGQGIDIFALSHPDSGLFSGADMVLRSANPVHGDAHYWSGGNFRIEQLNGALGNLVSPFDPVIRSLGDVRFNNYEGASLHIIAGGSVNLGTAIITAPEALLDGTGYLQETVELSNGIPLAIDGGGQATLDIRAGVSPEEVIAAEQTGFTPEIDFFFDDTAQLNSVTSTSSPTSAEIVIGDVFIIPPNGLVYLTNQYNPQTDLPPGTITITGQGLFQRDWLEGNGIDARGFGGDGSTVMIDARGDILLSTSFIDTSSDIGDAGQIALIAGRDIILSASAPRNSSIEAEAEAGAGGHLTLAAGRNVIVDSGTIDVSSARGGSLTLNAENIYLFGSNLSAEVTGTENSSGGSIALNARGNIRLDDSRILTELDEEAIGNAGSIVINTNNLTVTRSSVLDASTSGQGNAGDIEIYASGRVSFDRGEIFGNESPSVARSNVKSGAVGNGGDIVLRANSLYLVNGGRLEAIVDAPFVYSEDNITSAGRGNAGDIDVAVQNEMVIAGQIDRISSKLPSIFGSNAGVFPNSRSSGIFNLIDREAIGNGGTVEINARSLSLVDGGQIVASSYSQGNAGQIHLDIHEAIALSGTDILRRIGDNAEAVYLVTSAILNQMGQEAQGNSGGITIRAGSLAMTDVSEISASTFGQGSAGNLSLHIDRDLTLANLSNIRSVVEPGAIGNGGNIEIQTGSLALTNGAQIVAGVFRATDNLPGGQGNGGRIDINASESITLSGVSAIELPFPAVNPLNFSSDFPLVPVTHRDQLQTAGISSGILTITEIGATGQARDIYINTGALQIANGAVITAQTENSGDGGNILITANTLEALAGGQIITNTSSRGRAGDIRLNVRDRIALSGTDPTYNERLSQLGRGTIANTSENSGLFANTEAASTGAGGQIQLQTAILDLIDSAQILASTSGEGNAGNITVQDAEQVNLDRSTISTTVNPGSTGDGGDINIDTNALNLDRSNITASTSGQGNAGDIQIDQANAVTLNHSSLSTAVAAPTAIGNGGDITMQTGILELDDRSRISSSTAGEGNTGEILIRATDAIRLNDHSQITSEVQTGATGNSQQITLRTSALSLSDNATVSAATNGTGQAGDIRILDTDQVFLSNSTISTEVKENAVVAANSHQNVESHSRSRSLVSAQSNITIDTRSLHLDNNARITASTRGQGRAGNITVHADTIGVNHGSRLTTSSSSNQPAGNVRLNVQETTHIRGNGSGIFANTNAGGNGGSILLNTNALDLNDHAAISAQSTGRGEAGDIRLNALTLNATNSTLATTAQRASGGSIEINPDQRNGRISLNNSTITTNSGNQGGNIRLEAEQIILRGDSDLTTSSGGNGGNIRLQATRILAFDDSDIFANSRNASGGNIALDTPAFFGSGYVPNQATTEHLDGNRRVDLDATGSTQSGTITTPDASFVQNSLSDLPDNSVDSNQLLANSCIVHDRDQPQGQFLITGAGGLPERPGSVTSSPFPTGEIRTIPNDTETSEQVWQLGEPIVEPQSVYRLSDGRLVMSRECPSNTRMPIQ